MCHSCRNACGVVMLACGALLALAVPTACGGPVVLPTQNVSATNLTDGASRSESLDEMAGLEPSPLPVIDVGATSVESSTAIFYTTTAFMENTEPHATVIPLPAAVWTGLAGLSSIAVVSVARQFSRSRR